MVCVLARRNQSAIFAAENVDSNAGPIVRITPRELHIQDSDFYEKFNSSKLDKDGLFYDCTNLSQSAFGTKEHEVHRKRRAALNPYFSRSNIDAQVPLVKQKLQSFCEALHKSAEAGEVIRLDIRLHALTMDVVTQCVFGQSYGAIGMDREISRLSPMSLLMLL